MMKPGDEDELAAMVAGAKAPLAVRGGGSRGVVLTGDALSTAGLGGIRLYEPGAMTLVASAGTPLAEIEAALAAQNQRISFEPMDHQGLMQTAGIPTIGGVVAANVSGPRRVQGGACRDFLLGVRFVDGQGNVISNGGRVMKNVTGYDLVKLMAGSWGTLGILSEVSLKVLPAPETQATVIICNLDLAQAVQVMARALGSPFDVSGAAFDPATQGGMVMLRVEGFETSVAYRARRLSELLGKFGEVTTLTTPEVSDENWKRVRDVVPFHGQAGDVWRLSVKPSDAPVIAPKLEADGLLFDWGGGLIWALVPEGTDLRKRVGSFYGHATIVRANCATRARLGVFQPLSSPLEAISAGLRARFDPRGILNPGLMQPTVAA
jgi:glycolate oxidase FAD binding subunit